MRRMLAEDEVIVAPGVFNAISARLAEKAGLKAVYFSGGAFANSLGLPDLGVFTLSELVGAVRQITALIEIPLIVDVDTGFGEAINVMRTVTEMERVGAAAIHLEDQIMPKRCGHLAGKQVISVEEMMQKIVAAKEARTGDLVLIARTDARATHGLDVAIERAKAYVKAGADMIFPDALETAEEFSEFAEKVDAPLLANMTEYGKTPYLSAAQFQNMGYKVVIFPQTAFRVMLKAVADAYKELIALGTQKGLLDRMMSRSEVYELLDYYWYESADQRTARTAADILAQDGH
ncbi:MAG: methylisocitrate lyase [Acidobacteria bacterium]|nr:methylisocitrate lyase [Acidobacteriota bacterium]